MRQLFCLFTGSGMLCPHGAPQGTPVSQVPHGLQVAPKNPYLVGQTIMSTHVKARRTPMSCMVLLAISPGIGSPRIALLRAESACVACCFAGSEVHAAVRLLMCKPSSRNWCSKAPCTPRMHHRAILSLRTHTLCDGADMVVGPSGDPRRGREM